MSAFISSTWQANAVRIPDAGASIPLAQLPSAIRSIIHYASPSTAAEARRVMDAGGDLSLDATIELAALTVRYALHELGQRRS